MVTIHYRYGWALTSCEQSFILMLTDSLTEVSSKTELAVHWHTVPAAWHAFATLWPTLCSVDCCHLVAIKNNIKAIQ